MDFSTFGLHGCILANIKALGYETPTPIQEQAIPPVLEGRDMIGLAQTGTGKTAAFMLPIVQRLMKRASGGKKKGVRSLIIAPTRELAEQIAESARALGRKTAMRVATIYGGVGYSPQIRNLRNGANCVVACPGRLLDHINQGTIDLSGVEVLVLDEADHMFDMGFLPDLRKILSHLPKERQTLLFSATMPSSIEALAQDVLHDPARVTVGRIAPAATVSHTAWPVAQHLKTKLLLGLLGAHDGTTLVFTRTKHKAKQLAEQLERHGHTAASLQGNLSQNKRQSTLKAFKNGRYRVLVATDIAARGIDVSRVAHVVNYDLPDTPEAYTHRIGRTGRAERKGMAHSLTTRDDMRMLRQVERLIGKPLERKTLEGFNYDVPSPDGRGDRPQRWNSRPSRAPREEGRSNAAPRGGRPSRKGREQGEAGHGAEATPFEKDGARRTPRNGAGKSLGNASRNGAKKGAGAPKPGGSKPPRKKGNSLSFSESPMKRKRSAGNGNQRHERAASHSAE